MANKLTDRLRGLYQVGENNEFGTRSFADFIPPISIEAANRIEELETILLEARLELEDWNLQAGDEGTINLTKRIVGVLAI